MAPIQDVPPELILHICSFLRTEYEGKELIGDGREPRNQIIQSANESRRTLFNFSATCKTYRSMSIHELQGSIEVFGTSAHGISASPMASRLVSLLQHAHTGAMNPKSVRQLSISFQDNAIEYQVFDDEIATINRMASSMSLQVFQAPMLQRLHEPWNGVRGWTISHHHFARLFAQLVVMLLLNFKSVRHLTLQLSARILQNITEFASQTILMPQQDGNKNKICQLLTLRSLAMRTDPSEYIHLVANTMPQIGPGFGALFSWDVGAEVYLQGFAVLDALAGIAPKLGSIALDHCFISKSQLHQVLNRCQALEKFIFICIGAPAGYSLPSPGDTIDMLEKHTTTLKTLCLDLHDFDYSRNHIPLHGLEEFTALERLSLSKNTLWWFIRNAFRCEGIYKEVKRDAALNATITSIPFMSTIPPLLKVFHIADLTQGSQTSSISQEKLDTILKRIKNKPFFFQYSDLDGTSSVMWNPGKLRTMGVLACLDSSQDPALW